MEFLDPPARYAKRSTSRYAVLPVPYEGAVSWLGGMAAAPAAILEASAQVEWFDEETQKDLLTPGIVTIPGVPPAEDPDHQYGRIHQAATGLHEEGKFVLALGGDHSITPPLVAAAAKKHKELSVLQIDAHADLRDVYKNSRHCHACAMRRVLEIVPRLAQVGIRSWSGQEHRRCPVQVERFITAERVRRDPKWMDAALALLSDTVYVTVDVDGFDPSEAPGVGTPEPGGLHWPEVTALLKRVAAERNIVAADIVEVRPIPPSTVTEFLAARLACKIIAYTQG